MFRNSRLTTVAVAATCLLSTLACVQTNAVRLGTAPARGAVAESLVVIYRTAEQVPGAYQEIGLLNSSGESSWTNEAKMINSMRKKAAEMGANGIILDAMSEPSAGAKVAAAFLGTGAQRKGKAIAIYVVESDSSAAARNP